MLSILSAAEKDRVVSSTLEWCNERRKEKGLESLSALPRGERWDGESCPCGKACGYYVGYREYYVILPGDDDILKYKPGAGVGPVPDPVRDFVSQFDQGKLPEYEVAVSGI